MEKILKLRLHSNGNWSEINDNNGDKLAFELENNATRIVIELPDETSGYTHYLQVELPDGTSLLSSAITETTENSIRCLSIPVGYPITAQYGRVRIQYVGRKDNEGKKILSSVLSLDIEESVGENYASVSNPDFAVWTEVHINDLETRVTALENDEPGEVHADSQFSTNESIVVVDGTTGKKIKQGTKTISGILSDAATDAANKVGVEEERAKGVEQGLNTRVGALETTVGDASSGLVKRVTDLENDEPGEVHADSQFSTNEAIIVVDGTSGKKIKQGTKTITGILSDAATDAANKVGVEEERAKGVEQGLNTRVGALETTVGDASSGLVKKTNDLETAVGGKQPTIDSSHKLDADLVDDTNTTNKFVTASDKTKLSGIEANAQVNDLEGVQVGGVELVIDANKKVNIEVTNTTTDVDYIMDVETQEESQGGEE